jgi:hypothetical protein
MQSLAHTARHFTQVTVIILRLNAERPQRARWTDAEGFTPERPKNVLLDARARFANAGGSDKKQAARYAEKTIAQQCLCPVRSSGGQSHERHRIG